MTGKVVFCMKLYKIILVSNDDILYLDCDVTFHVNLLDTTQQIH